MPPGTAKERSTLTNPKSPLARNAPQLVLPGEGLPISLWFSSQPVLKETSGRAPGLPSQTSQHSGCCRTRSTTPRRWTTWCAAARMSAPLTTTPTTRTWLSWFAAEGNPRTLTHLVDGTSQQRTDAISSVTKVGLLFQLTSL